MTLAEFNDAVKRFAGNRCSSVTIDVTNYTTGETSVRWKAYVADIGWREGISPELTIAALDVPETTGIPSIEGIAS